jgi:hypothetical protein
MSRKRKPAASPPGQPLSARNGKCSVSDDDFDILRGRDPEVMCSLFQQIKGPRAVLSWLIPAKTLFGLPYHYDVLPWITIVDDLDPTAMGPASFDGYSLEWWATRADAIAIDAATPTVPFYDALGSLAARGLLVLIVQTVEARRLLWHQYFVSVRPPGMRTMMMHHLKNTRPGGPKQVARMGRLYDDFVSDRPVATSTGSAPSCRVIMGATARPKIS